MQNLLKLQQKIVPEFIELLERRYNILRTIYYNQPIGRRILANCLLLGERSVRNEVNFLKNQNFINVHNSGMYITAEGEEIIDRLKDFIHEIKGLSDIEETIKKYLNLKKVLVVPGDCETDSSVLKEIGRAASNYTKSVIKNNCKIAVTGGKSVKELVDNIPKINKFSDILVLPARGGMGRDVEIQANTLAAQLAQKIGGTYKLLHVPDSLSNNALETILMEKNIKDIVEKIRNSDILIYGIGRADEMARRRELQEEQIYEIIKNGAVGEAFGHYFDEKGNIIYYTPTIGVKHADTEKINTLIAVAGGRSKAKAIMAIERNRSQSVLVTDEGAAAEIMKIIKSERMES